MLLEILAAFQLAKNEKKRNKVFIIIALTDAAKKRKKKKRQISYFFSRVRLVISNKFYNMQSLHIRSEHRGSFLKGMGAHCGSHHESLKKRFFFIFFSCFSIFFFLK